MPSVPNNVPIYIISYAASYTLVPMECIEVKELHLID